MNHVERIKEKDMQLFSITSSIFGGGGVEIEIMS